MIFPFRDKDGYNLDAAHLPCCPFSKHFTACRTLDCAAFELCYDGISGYCGFTQGLTCINRARVPVA